MGFAERIVEYMRKKGFRVDTLNGWLNIVYVEGCDREGRPNRDEDDRWNDRRILLTFAGGYRPEILLNASATTEPGRLAVMSKSARMLGGAARIGFGQYVDCWMMGWHKGNLAHQALVQVSPVTVHRDGNRDGKRPGDKIVNGIFGINQHTVTPKFNGFRVGHQSAGCLVGQNRGEHQIFLDMLKKDPRYLANPNCLWTTTIIAGDDLNRVVPYW